MENGLIKVNPEKLSKSAAEIESALQEAMSCLQAFPTDVFSKSRGSGEEASGELFHSLEQVGNFDKETYFKMFQYAIKIKEDFIIADQRIAQEISDKLQ